MAAAARACGVRVVAADAEVVERGRGDGVYLSVTAIGRVRARLSPSLVRPGDRIFVTGPVGDHGTAVMLAREDLGLGSSVQSDSGEVASVVHALHDEGVAHSCARDPPRGGLATALCEIARSAGVGVLVDERVIPVRAEVADACELLGLDPLYVACEGRAALFVPERDVEIAQRILSRIAPESALIGEVTAAHRGLVRARGPFGGERVLDLLSGEQLPRIC
jgi:hydrogenase expression/formation protein HypE